MSEQSTVEVETAYGWVSGTAEDGIARFLGMPYGRAPIGELRFAAPVPPEPWQGVRTADTFGATPPKPPLGGKLGEIMPDPNVAGDEWLNLNVWTTDTEASLPVLVWIHGGGFTTGSSAVPAYDGATFARDGVVCVSINYRLGVDGFGYLPDAPAPANRGLLDQIAALTWVRENIAAFGGDPGDITLCGESAGAMSVLALLSRDDGLFHKAIVQSGNAHIGQTPGDAALVLGAVAERLGVEPTAAALAGVDIDDLTEAQGEVSKEVSQSADVNAYGASTIASCGLAFLPVIDGDVLTRLPAAAIADGAGGQVPLLMGTTTEEFRLFIVTSALVSVLLPGPFKTRVKAYGAPDSAYDTYATNDTAAYPRSKPSGIAAAVLTDRMFRIPTYRVAEARGENDGAPTYLYEFGWRSPVIPNDVQVKLGACHSLDLPFAWDTLSLPANQKFTGTQPPQNLADALHNTWVEFARTGQASWKEYDAQERPVMTFRYNNTTSDQVVNDPRKTERELWDGRLGTA
ncbi:carboxylesterase/lipase family protein [Streptomyces sp. NPDC060209]|uniref:carboxylesterase/lipase family protein n=1 Tax=Streptomyces sp. NPDC060209 TaxID=3347073 RepID=UPI0036634771